MRPPIPEALTDYQYIYIGEVQQGQSSLYVYASPDSYEPLARLDGRPGQEAIFYFHSNVAGRPEQLTDEDGHTVWHSDHEAWGKSREEWRHWRHVPEQNLRFQGQYLDRETGLHYNTFRYFDPQVGRFTQPDPIGLAGGSIFIGMRRIRFCRWILKGSPTATQNIPRGTPRSGRPREMLEYLQVNMLITSIIQKPNLSQVTEAFRLRITGMSRY